MCMQNENWRSKEEWWIYREKVREKIQKRERELKISDKDFVLLQDNLNGFKINSENYIELIQA